jgi:hypothetical protein
MVSEQDKKAAYVAAAMKCLKPYYDGDEGEEI